MPWVAARVQTYTSGGTTLQVMEGEAIWFTIYGRLSDMEKQLVAGELDGWLAEVSGRRWVQAMERVVLNGGLHAAPKWRCILVASCFMDRLNGGSVACRAEDPGLMVCETGADGHK